MGDIEVTECPIESLETTVACHSRDMGAHGKDVWIWGIICGWDEESFEQLKRQYPRWTPEAWARLARLHKRFCELKDLRVRLAAAKKLADDCLAGDGPGDMEDVVWLIQKALS